MEIPSEVKKAKWYKRWWMQIIMWLLIAAILRVAFRFIMFLVDGV
jgi:hypothetical protein